MPSRRILLCVTGLSPQIVTETLYALAVKGDFVPDEIHLITTREGAERAALTLLDADPEQGHFYKLCRDYDLDAGRIRFGGDTIHVIPDGDGAPLTDIRTLADNEAAADAITRVVRELTADPDSTVHASIAGGRKTMGFYLGYALSLFGRAQDRLSHVLVPAPFESHPQFFYPPARPRVLYDRSERPMRADEAEITLADIPFVRMRDGLTEMIREGGVSFSAAVQQAQRSLGPPELVLDSTTRRIGCGGVIIELKPVDFAFLAWFARRALAGKPGIQRNAVSDEELGEYLTEYHNVAGVLSGDYERVEEKLEGVMKEEYFDERRARLHKCLKKALGTTGAEPYLIASDRRRPRSRYALGLTPRQVCFAPIHTEDTI